MNACNGITKQSINEAVEITRLEPVIIEVEEDNKMFPHPHIQLIHKGKEI